RERSLMAVELQKVVGGGYQTPFRATRRSPTADEAIEPPVELHLRKHRLDRYLASSVELGPVLGGEHAAHERVETLVPPRPSAFSQTGVRRNEDLCSTADDALHLAFVPVAGVSEHHLR